VSRDDHKLYRSKANRNGHKNMVVFGCKKARTNKGLMSFFHHFSFVPLSYFPFAPDLRAADSKHTKEQVCKKPNWGLFSKVDNN